EGFIRKSDDKVREFAAAALGKLSPDAFASMLPELTASEDAMLRRLAFQLAPPEVISPDQLGAAAFDPDPWVRAAAAVAGASRRPPWEGSTAVFDRLVDANDVQHRAAAVWAASFVGDHKMVAAALVDPEPRVRLEGLRSFAKMKANVPGSASGLIACMRDPERDVKRAALREATRWRPPIIAARTARPSMPSCTSRWTTTSSSWRRAGLRPCARCTESEVSRQWSAAFAPSSPALRPRAWRRC